MSFDTDLEIEPDPDVDAVLEHFGIKGMQWGIRRDQRKLDKADNKWAKAARRDKGWFSDYNNMANQMNHGELDRINDDPRFKGKDVKTHGPLRTAYQEEVANTAVRLLNKASEDRMGVSPSGAIYIDWEYPSDLNGWPSMIVVDNRLVKEVEHSDKSETGVRQELKVTWTEDGHILNITLPTLKQSEINLEVDEFLEHYGIKGMRWGIRRDLDNLNDEELKRTIERMRLEKQYADIADQSITTKTKKFTAKYGEKVFATAVTAAAGFAIKRYLDTRFPSQSDVAKRTADALALARLARAGIRVTQ